jgi:uncharacterized protein YbjT (DUF2867 family)
MSRCLVMGATGCLGSALVPSLIEAGHDVRALVRDPDSPSRLPAEVTVHQGDATRPQDVQRALDGVHTVYFLVHSLKVADFAAVDRRAAVALAIEAAAAGVSQIVYVGGTRPRVARTESVSEHLSSRAEVGDILVAGRVPALVLQASMIIGAGSPGFDLLEHLARFSPAVPAPAWASNRSRPVALSDVVHYLTAAAELPMPVNGIFEASGPETISYLALVQRTARVTGRPALLPFPAPLWSHRLAAAAAGLTTPVSAAVAAPLFLSLDHDLLPEGSDITEVLPEPPGGRLSVDNAIRRAGRPVRRTPSAGRVFVGEHSVPCSRRADEVWRTVTGIGGENGWHTLPLVWAVRGAVDRLAGGVGLYRGRRPELAEGDVVDFWTVCTRDDRERRLVLRADMKMPGSTFLEMRVDEGASGVRYHQKVTFTADGLAGELYWRLQKPLHDLVFGTMAQTISTGGTARPRSLRLLRGAARDGP